MQSFYKNLHKLQNLELNLLIFRLGNSSSALQQTFRHKFLPHSIQPDVRMHFNLRENILFHPDLLCLKNNGFGNLGTLIKRLEFFTCIEILYEIRISLFIEIFMNFLHWSQENLTKVSVILPRPKGREPFPAVLSWSGRQPGKSRWPEGRGRQMQEQTLR